MRTFLLFIVFSALMLGQQKGVSNIEYKELPDRTYLISYDLNEDADKTFEVNLFLRSEEDDHFSLKLNMVTGDVGKGKFAGRGRKIVWNKQVEFAGELSTFSFEVIASVQKGIPWYYYVGSAVVAGGITAILVSGKKAETSTPVKTEIIDPPVRP